MPEPVLTENDIKEIAPRGMTREMVEGQIEKFKKGFPFSRLVRPCTQKDGIIVLDDNDISGLIKKHESAALAGRCMKFVPASGAASRMFKLLASFKNSRDEIDISALPAAAGRGDEDSRLLLEFVNGINKFPFFESLDSAMSNAGESIGESLSRGEIRKILEYLLDDKGLGFSDTPKGLIPFHRYKDHSRTPLEEHLAEGAGYTMDRNGAVNIHFTVSRDHLAIISKHIEAVRHRYESKDTTFRIGQSCQKPSTDTIAVDMNNRPFRDKSGKLLFRPGGHGALLENLSDLDGDIVFIKNIDNVVPDRLKNTTFIYKKALGGYLVELQQEIFGYLEKLTDGNSSRELINSIFDFLKDRLFILPPEDLLQKSIKEIIKYLIYILNRPLRVCGMVKNTGEPGGGPFWVDNQGKRRSMQIVESSQIDMNSKEQMKIFKSSTHFNPVDLVCGIRDYSGKPFDLNKYVDHNTGFISKKSKHGKDLKALELPGLWNGSMAFWNSVFVEVPETTFNPVKTVFDLLRNEHQSDQHH